MLKDDIIHSITGKDKNKKKSKMPAILDYWQSITGLLLAIFILFHIIFESSIVVSKDLMQSITKLFELEFIIDGGSGLFIMILVIVISIIFVSHAFLAMRKFPSSYKQYMRLKTHSTLMNHEDTNLWFIQISTGFVMFFLGSIHLYLMWVNATNIGPFISSDRIYTDGMWAMYLLLLVSVVLHTMVGIYRLIIKWDIVPQLNIREHRPKIKKVIKIITAIYLTFGLLALSTYIVIGYQHQDNYGQKYISTTQGE